MGGYPIVDLMYMLMFVCLTRRPITNRRHSANRI